MSSLVVDASAVVDALTGEADDVRELNLLLSSVPWISAPFLIDYELHAVLRKMALRGSLEAESVADVLELYRSLRLSHHAVTPEMSRRIWDLRHSLSAYDAAYVALAEVLDVPLVTHDLRLAKAAQALGTVEVETPDLN
ncbi:type II toxin-antitoxin system VapC family toxin [Thermoactinospora rubra]|uniref:type II toxin-antitoxin system VapC family toxin n=1 Tax=Thermoactinospora rubra TaxID=1088767 RepID=UPI000A108CD5|nr:type II toxin-antitoxin system VapC family toxin [Thermoactinospora rubra]